MDAYELNKFNEQIINAFKVRFDKSNKILGYIEGITYIEPLVVNRFKSGEEQVVFNMGVLTTGFDHPSLDCIVLLRPVRSIGLYCLDLKTEILTPNGFKKYNELEIGQNVYGFEKETNEIKIVKVKNKIFRDIFKNENFYSIKTNSVDIRTTDKHRMLYDRKSNSGWKIKEMKKLALFRDGFKIPCAGIEKSNGVPLTDAELRFIGWVMTDGNINKHTNGTRKFFTLTP